MQPIARKEELVIQESAGEVLVYDLRVNKALCLNRTSALIWKNCDGKKEIPEIVRDVEKTLGYVIGEEVVWFALSQLEKENLLANDERLPDRFDGLSRREVIKKIGLTSMVALPVISSLIAPMAIHAQSCIPNDANCTTSAQCCSMCCKEVGGGINQCKPGGGNCLP